MEDIHAELPQRLLDEQLGIIVAKAKDVPESYIAQVIEKSRQPHVMKFEGHEDAEGRFKDLAAYKHWASKERIVYLLVKNADREDKIDVGGIIWFGERTNELIDSRYNLTFGIRLYEGCVGKGLAVPFMKATHQDIERFFPGRAIWLDFAEDNIAAQKAYQSFGYEYLTRAEGRIVMGYHIGG